MKTLQVLDGSQVHLGNIYCIGRNYAKHVVELGNSVPETPLVFLKSTAALRGLTDTVLAFPDETFHHEVELVIYIGMDVPPHQTVEAQALTHATLGLDLTRREVQNRLKKDGHPWTLAKSFAGSAIVAPLLKLDDPTAFPWNEVTFSLAVGGEFRQSGKASDMLIGPVELARYIHSFSPLQRGDLIFTGTPEGVAGLRRGDPIKMTLNLPGSGTHFWTGEL